MYNLVVLRGHLNRTPEERLLPSGDRLTTLDVTVRAPVGASRRDDVRPKADAVPLAWIDAPAWVANLGPGAELLVVGRVRRRFFRAGGSLQSRTEVLVDHAAPTRHPARCAAVLRRVADAFATMVA